MSSCAGVEQAVAAGAADIGLAQAESLLPARAAGVPVVFGHEARGGRMQGLRARPGRWEPVADAPVAAVYDRFPSRSRADDYAALAGCASHLAALV